MLVPLFFAAIISAPKMLAVVKIGLHSFPREIGHLGIVGHTVQLLQTIGKALFDPFILVESSPNNHMGSWFEWTAYIGLSSVLLIVIGTFCLLKHARYISILLIFVAFIFYFSENYFGSSHLTTLLNGLLLGLISAVIVSKLAHKKIVTNAFLILLGACFLQFVISRTTHAADFLRWSLPLLSNLTNYHRGNVLWVILFSFVLAYGFDQLFRGNFSWSKPLALFFVVLMIADLCWVYSKASFSMNNRELKVNTQAHFVPSFPIERAAYGCINPLLGYRGQFNQSAVNFKQGYLDIRENDKFNVNYVNEIYKLKNTEGRYLEEGWPLWPKSQEFKLKAFLSGKQIMDLPAYFRWASFFSLLFFAIYILLVGWIIFVRYRSDRSERR
jgi:hypothetical protein